MNTPELPADFQLTNRLIDIAFRAKREADQRFYTKRQTEQPPEAEQRQD